LFLALASVVWLAVVPAHAQLVRRAEDGTVHYLLSEPQGLDAPVEVGRDETAWTETLRPSQVVRLTGSGVDRFQPVRLPGLQAGEILFAYRLSSGLAYCPTRSADLHPRRVQCYRDFDDDGDFDGGYMTNARSIQSTILPGGLHNLASIPPVTYESADASEAPAVSASIVFSGWRDGRARFRIRVEQEYLDDIDECEPLADGACEIHQLVLRVTELPQRRARIELVAARPQRSITVCFDTSIPGSPCPER
jgi:hypothetical protein